MHLGQRFQRWRQRIPSWLTALWVMYVILLVGGLYILAQQHAAINEVATQRSGSILWDLSQIQRELLRLGILLERTHVPQDAPTPDALRLQGDLIWSQFDQLVHGARHTWIQPFPERATAVDKIQRFLEDFDTLLRQAEAISATTFTPLRPRLTEVHTSANWLMLQIQQDRIERSTRLGETLVSFRHNVVQYAIGLTVLIAMLMYMTWRQMRSEQALRASEQRFREVLENVHLAAVGVDTEGKITFCNDYLLRLTGQRRTHVLGRDWFTSFLPADQQEEVQHLFEQGMLPVFIQGSLPVHYEHDIVTHQGERRTIAWNTIPLHDASKQVIGATSVGVDLTEQKRAAEALQTAHDELEQRVRERTADLQASNASLQHAIAERQQLEDEILKIRKLESVGLLAGGIAHDFNNILTAIMGNVSLGKQFADASSKVYGRLEAAEKACHRATELTQQLLTFSKGGAPIKRPVSITELIKESANFALRGSNVRCEFAIQDHLWPVDVDEGQMSQVISNIIINADQAMPQGGIVRVQAENLPVDMDHPLPLRAGHYVRISINDHGVGIPQEHLSKIFDPYFTTKPRGSGLGLATAYAILQKHDGYLAVESAVGMGTTFFLYLPASSQTMRVASPPAARSYHGSGRILVMDDEEAIRELAGQMLMQLGYAVESACDGTEAIALYSKAKDTGQPFDAVIMDLTIPGGMGGKEAMRRLRELDPQIKAIVSSGYSTDPIMANFRHYGFRGVVVKPYNLDDLSTALHRVLFGEGATKQA